MVLVQCECIAGLRNNTVNAVGSEQLLRHSKVSVVVAGSSLIVIGSIFFGIGNSVVREVDGCIQTVVDTAQIDDQVTVDEDPDVIVTGEGEGDGGGLIIGGLHTTVGGHGEGQVGAHTKVVVDLIGVVAGLVVEGQEGIGTAIADAQAVGHGLGSAFSKVQVMGSNIAALVDGAGLRSTLKVNTILIRVKGVNASGLVQNKGQTNVFINGLNAGIVIEDTAIRNIEDDLVVNHGILHQTGPDQVTVVVVAGALVPVVMGCIELLGSGNSTGSVQSDTHLSRGIGAVQSCQSLTAGSQGVAGNTASLVNGNRITCHIAIRVAGFLGINVPVSICICKSSNSLVTTIVIIIMVPICIFRVLFPVGGSSNHNGLILVIALADLVHSDLIVASRISIVGTGLHLCPGQVVMYVHAAKSGGNIADVACSIHCVEPHTVAAVIVRTIAAIVDGGCSIPLAQVGAISVKLNTCTIAGEGRDGDIGLFLSKGVAISARSRQSQVQLRTVNGGGQIIPAIFNFQSPQRCIFLAFSPDHFNAFRNMIADPAVGIVRSGTDILDIVLASHKIGQVCLNGSRRGAAAEIQTLPLIGAGVLQLGCSVDGSRIIVIHGHGEILHRGSFGLCIGISGHHGVSIRGVEAGGLSLGGQRIGGCAQQLAVVDGGSIFHQHQLCFGFGLSGLGLFLFVAAPAAPEAAPAAPEVAPAPTVGVASGIPASGRNGDSQHADNQKHCQNAGPNGSFHVLSSFS